MSTLKSLCKKKISRSRILAGRRGLAWLLIVCLCMMNMNSLVFATENGNGNSGAATPAEAEVWMPGTAVSGQDLLDEAERVINENAVIDFNQLVKLSSVDDEDDSAAARAEKYQKMFEGYVSFLLYYDNDTAGKMLGEDENAYGYILVRVAEDAYMSYLEKLYEEDDVSYSLTGAEKLTFLYINGTDMEVTYHLNFTDIKVDGVSVPSLSSFAETEEEELKASPAEAEELEEENAKASPSEAEEEEEEEVAGPAGEEEVAGGAAGSFDSEESGTDESQAADEEQSSDESQPSDENQSFDESQPSDENQSSDENPSSDEEQSSDENQATEENQGTEGSNAGENQNDGGSAGDESSSVEKESGNTGSESGDVGSEDKDTDSESQDTGSESGNAGNEENDRAAGDSSSDSGNSGSESADSSSDSGNSGSKSADSSSDSGNSDNGSADSSSDSGSSDNGSAGSSSDNGNSDNGSTDNDSDSGQQVSMITKYVPRVMGPNQDADSEEDTIPDDMTFDEWQDEEEEDEDEYDYEDEDDTYSYESSSASAAAVATLSLTTVPALLVDVNSQPTLGGMSMFSLRSVSSSEAAVVSASETTVAAVQEAAGASISSTYKQIEKIANSDNYKLHIGLSGTAPGLDVVLVIDNSNSMYNLKKDANGNTYRDENKKRVVLGDKFNLKEVLTGSTETPTDGFVDSILSSSKNNMSVVLYGSEAESLSIGTDNAIWSNSLEAVEDTINSITDKCDEMFDPEQYAQAGNTIDKGATNYEDALLRAEEVIASREDTGNIPVVIFMSDGVPSLHNVTQNPLAAPASDADRLKWYDTTVQYKRTGQYYGNTSSPGNEEGSLAINSNNTHVETIYAAQQFHANQDSLGTIVYSVGFGTAEQFYLEYIAYGEDVADESADRVVMASDSSDLTDAIADVLEKLEFKNVKIIDQLSENVELIDPDINNCNPEVWKIEDGVRSKLSEDEYESLTYDSATRTVTLSFGEDTVLDTDLIYELSFDITPSKTAIGKFLDSGYTDVGEANTDYNQNISDGKDGFFSNTTSSRIEFGEGGKILLPRPVVTVPDSVDPVRYHKYIKDEGDGTYTVTLDALSKVKTNSTTETTYVPADIMMVIDKTGSMRFYMDITGKSGDARYVIGTNGSWTSERGMQSRGYFLNTALDTVLSLADDENLDVLFGGYKFSILADSFLGWYDNATSAAKLKLKVSECDGETYPAEGLKPAIQKLNTDSRENAKKYLLFFTDGSLDGSAEIASKNLTYKYVSGDTNLITTSNLKVFCIGVSPDANTEYLTELANLINNDAVNQANNVTAEVMSAPTEEDLNAALAAIKNDIIQNTTTSEYGVKDVVITDILSDYVDLVSTAEEIVVMMDPEGDAEASELAAENYTVTITTDAETDNPKITVTFDEDYELVQNAVYSISYVVKPSQLAKDEYVENYVSDSSKPYVDIEGEEIKGDEGTDAPGNTTSSGKPGFHSNEEATLTYTIDGKKGEEEYPHPVIQVPTGKLTLKKSVDGDVPDGAVYTFEVKFDTGKVGEVSDDAVYSEGTYTVTLTGGGEVTFDKVPIDTTYTITETEASVITGTDADEYVWTKVEAEVVGTPSEATSSEATRVEGSTLNGEELTVNGTVVLLEDDAADDGNQVTFTNTFKEYGYITIVKQLDGEEEKYPTDQTFVFNVAPQGTHAGNYDSSVEVTVGTPLILKVDPTDVENNVEFLISEDMSKANAEAAWYTTVAVAADGDSAQAETKTSGTVKDGETITFTNYYYKHDITIEKQMDRLLDSNDFVANNSGSLRDEYNQQEYTFKVDLTVNDKKLSVADINLSGTDKNGDAKAVTMSDFAATETSCSFRIILQEGDKVQITDLPKEVTAYVVTEELDDSVYASKDYRPSLKATTLNGQASTATPSNALAATASQADQVVFTNELVKNNGKLIIKKYLVKENGESTAAEAAVKAKEDMTFVFKVVGRTVDGSQVIFYETVTVQEGDSYAVGEFEVPIGYYNVYEENYLQWTEVNAGPKAVMVSNDDSSKNTAAFFNYQVKDNYFTDVAAQVNTVDKDGFNPSDDANAHKKVDTPVAQQAESKPAGKEDEDGDED